MGVGGSHGSGVRLSQFVQLSHFIYYAKGVLQLVLDTFHFFDSLNLPFHSTSFIFPSPFPEHYIFSIFFPLLHTIFIQDNSMTEYLYFFLVYTSDIIAIDGRLQLNNIIHGFLYRTP